MEALSSPCSSGNGVEQRNELMEEIIESAVVNRRKGAKVDPVIRRSKAASLRELGVKAGPLIDSEVLCL